MTAALCFVFLLSGAAALMFETLWFRQAGLAVGNTVWASALVTASFMAGLAIGNAAVARWGSRVRRPLIAYAGLEVLVAATGLALVLVFPLVGKALAPLMGSLGAVALNALRVMVSFALLLLPATAMGATLPLLASVLSARDPNFGRVLGRLYGWNTLGAVVGTLAGDLVLIQALGIKGTALVAGGLDLVAAASAVALASRVSGEAAASGNVPTPPIDAYSRRLLAAAFLSGGILLALEVVWFRFLLHFTTATSWTFAAMLAVVLLGIAAGGLVAAAILGRWSSAYRWAAPVALASGFGVAASYASFLAVVPPMGTMWVATLDGYLRLSLALMLPVSLLSGMLFTFLGRALQAELRGSVRSTGLLTLANTVGAATGALLGGFVLLPGLGIERSLFALGALYAIVGLLALARDLAPRERIGAAAGGLLLAAALALFPFGLMANQFVPRVVARWANEGYRLIAFEEGLGETVMITRRDVLGAPESYRLVTNGLAMSATNYVGRRFMALSVWWPAAVHPGLRSALQISYGLGTTSRALVETKELERIDIVDTSESVLRLSALAQESPAKNPLADPRVHAHIEDGRFFLLTTPRRYDLITADPPPPKAAGIGSLYSREYFELVRSRLAPGGITTYWLPVYQMTAAEGRAVMAGFCAAFEDCSLWTGHGLDWILIGTNGARGPVSAARFEAQWRDPVVSRRLREAGIDTPAQLGAVFIADAAMLRTILAGTPPLDDDHPYRLLPSTVSMGPSDTAWFTGLMQIEEPARRFFESELVKRFWPREWLEPTRAAFAAQNALNASILAPPEPAGTGLMALEQLITLSRLYAPVLWAVGTNVVEVQRAQEAAARGDRSPMVEEILGLDALARRDFREAERRLALAEPHAPHSGLVRMWRVLALGLAGDADGCARLLAEARALGHAPGADPAPWQWLAARFSVSGETEAAAAN